MTRPSLQPHRTSAREDGFALVLVIWGLALISLLIVSVTTTARYRVISASNIAEGAKAEALAEAGVNLVRLELLAGLLGAAPEDSNLIADGRPRLCVMPGGALAALAVEDEGGKVDLNTASPKLLTVVLRGFGADFDEADRLAAAIAEFSRPSTSRTLDHAVFQAYGADGRSYGPKKAPFETALELDQVLGMRSDLFRAVLPNVTVHSRKPGVDPRVARPALLAALAGRDPQSVLELSRRPAAFQERESLMGIPAEFLMSSNGRSFLIHVEVRTAGGGLFAQEAIVELTGGATPEVLREWRRGAVRFASVLESAAQQPGAWPPC